MHFLLVSVAGGGVKVFVLLLGFLFFEFVFNKNKNYGLRFIVNNTDLI